MTSFIDLRTSKAKSALSKDREDHSNNKLIGSGISGLGSSRVGAQNQQISDLSFSKNGLSTINRTPGQQNQTSEITLLRPNKRLEGHDQYKLGPMEEGRYDGKFDSGKRKNDNFKKNVKNIQNKVSDENIEEEYINGLQDEIKLLEYELKLLKDKDLEQQASLSQLDKFFNDGVPLNENILAMKNQYNIIKHDAEGKLMKYEDEEKKVVRNNEELKADLVKLEEYFDLFSKEIKEKEKKYKVILDDLRKGFFEVKHVSGEIEKEFKIIQGKNRKYQDEIMTFSRQAEKEEVLSTHRDETRNQSMIKLKQNIIEKEKKITDLTKELEELKGNEIVNPAIMHLEKENSEIMKQLIMISSEMNSANARCTDMQFLLEMRAKERMTEMQQKRDLTMKLENLLLHYKEEHNVKEKVLQQKVEEKEKLDISEMKKRTENLKNLIKLYKDRVTRCERESENLIEAKMDVQQKTLDEEQKKQMCEKELDEMKTNYKEIRSGLELYLIQEKENKNQINPLNLEMQELTERKPQYEEEIKRLKDAIHHYMKQIELADHVKKFNLEELKVIAFNNNQVNAKILDFMQNFDNIQRMSKLPPNFLGKTS